MGIEDEMGERELWRDTREGNEDEMHEKRSGKNGGDGRKDGIGRMWGSTG